MGCAIAVTLLLAALCGGCVNVAVIGADNEITVQMQGAGRVEDRQSERRTGRKDWKK